jgi:trimethylamine--corrinoid protein Co-methyltransferase
MLWILLKISTRMVNIMVELRPLEPIKTPYRLRCVGDKQLQQLQDATLNILERTGVKFPSEGALKVLADHGAHVDFTTQIVRFPRDLVLATMKSVPRRFKVGGRIPFYDFHLGDGCTYFTTDGCGVETIDLETRQRRPSSKADVAMMARVVDYLPGIAFCWPMVSSQEHGRTAPLHDLDAGFRNTLKHVQSETIMGGADARYALEMSTVIAGSKEEMRSRPNFSLLVCTIAPLVQDKDGIEAAMVLAEAGVPVGFLAMPTLGTTAPATLAGALAMGDAEVISATVLTQMINPGTPVFHSIMQAWADPSSGKYVSYPLDARGRYAPVEMAHHWGMPCLGACYGTDARDAGTWQSGSEVALDSYMIGLTGVEWVTGLGLTHTYTRLYPESLLLDYDIHQKARYALMELEISDETLALDTIESVGAGGHYLAQKHTRKHMREAMKRGVCHQLTSDGSYQDPRQFAIDQTKWILANHQPEPLDAARQAELDRILQAADKQLN